MEAGTSLIFGAVVFIAGCLLGIAINTSHIVKAIDVMATTCGK